MVSLCGVVNAADDLLVETIDTVPIALGVLVLFTPTDDEDDSGVNGAIGTNVIAFGWIAELTEAFEVGTYDGIDGGGGGGGGGGEDGESPFFSLSVCFLWRFFGLSSGR